MAGSGGIRACVVHVVIKFYWLRLLKFEDLHGDN